MLFRSAALLGGFAAVSGRIAIESVELAIHQKFANKVAAGNCTAARAAYDHVKREIAEAAHA